MEIIINSLSSSHLISLLVGITEHFTSKSQSSLHQLSSKCQSLCLLPRVMQFLSIHCYPFYTILFRYSCDRNLI